LKKVVILYGSTRPNDTNELIFHIKKELQKLDQYHFVEYNMQKDLPNFCRGCLNCVLVPKMKSIEQRQMDPIISDIKSADGLILSSITYCEDHLMDHNPFLDTVRHFQIPYRPDPLFFNKIGLVISTESVSVSKKANKEMEKALLFMGFKKVLKFVETKENLRKQEINEPLMKKISTNIKQLSRVLHENISLRFELKDDPYFTKSFRKTKRKVKSLREDHPDKQYWIEQGWINK
jgi:multimeric flavodoxin WrbA